ncbi:RNA polymerase sigma factor [Ruania zhangjianzhongii]|uniref:RNA polymerase sigma factor n=1 Tax=Ruania zhangjianzhongii TaxID=2603206 RepID=UPI0011CC1064|nr:sigma-70 family RNA polymerase sigma factor [Ruania zhangjianzhongii]
MTLDLPIQRGADLVRAVQGGDTLALVELLDLLEPYVGRICGAIALDAGADAAQEALMIVLRRLPTLREPVTLYAWVRTIAVREALRHAGGTGRALAVDPTGLDAVPKPGDPELATDVRDVLHRLRPEHRAVLVLRDLHGMDEATAAGYLEVPPGTVKSRLHRARAAFRKAWTS